MRMTKLEKNFVNSKKRGENSIKTAGQLFHEIDLSNVRTVLEIGCGIGTLTSYLAEKYKWHVTGIDLDPEQIESAKSTYMENEHLRFLKADATGLPFEEDEFDMVLSFMVLHHIPRRDRAMEEINRVLKPKGLCVINDLAVSRLVASIFRGLVNRGSIYAVDDIIRRFRGDNFEIVYAEKQKGMIFDFFSIVVQKC